jgi:hypothetical protein
MTDASFLRDEIMNPPGLMKPWMGEDGTTFREVIAGEFDNAIIAAELTGDARSPLKCDATVLPYHARDRGIRRYITESETSWRTRLAKWKQIWQSAGRAWGLLRQLRILLLPYGRPLLRHVVTAGDGSISQWHTLEPGDGLNDYFEVGGLDPEFSSHRESPGNFIWDANATAGHWSRFWIIIQMDGITDPDISAGEWDGASLWDGTNVWDGGLSNPVNQDIVSMMTEWKAAHAQFQGLLYVPDDTVLSPSGTSVTVPPWNYTTYPDGEWDQINKRNPDVIFAYVHP